MGTDIYLFFEKYNTKSQQWELIIADHPEFVSFSLRKKELSGGNGCSVDKSQLGASESKQLEGGDGYTSSAKAGLVDDKESPKEKVQKVVAVAKRAVPNIIDIGQAYELFTILAGVQSTYFRSKISPVLYTRFDPKKTAEEEAKEVEREKEAELLFGIEPHRTPALRGLPDDVSRPVFNYYCGAESESEDNESNGGGEGSVCEQRGKAYCEDDSMFYTPMYYTLEELTSFDWNAHSIAYSGHVNASDYANFIKANKEAEEKRAAGGVDAVASAERGVANMKPRRYTVAASGYCQGASGDTVRNITNQQMDALLRGEAIVLPAPPQNRNEKHKSKTITVKQGEGLTFYTRVSWETPYSGTSYRFFNEVIPFLESLSKGNPSHARIVFFFQ